MAQTNKFEKQFLNALRDIFVGAKVEGDSGYVNLMRIKSRYYEQGVFPQLQKDINTALQPFPDFREELFDKLYTFFQRYFSESGSIYFRYTALHQNVYEKVYTDDRDVILFWKTHMLYYVKTDRIFTSLNVEVDGVKFFFDASKMTLKKSNEKREVVYAFRKVQPEDGTLVFDVAYSEKGKTTRMDDILKDIKKANGKLDDETLNKAFRVFEKQSEVDFFINKDARAFLQEQFELWLYQYLFAGQNVWSEARLAQLQALKAIAYKVIDFISQFEDELVKIWNKPKFVRNSHYVLTLDKLGGSPVLEKLFTHPKLPQQVQEWRDLGMIGEDFKLEMLTQKDAAGAPLHKQYQYLPIDTKYFSDLELDILELFDDLDAALDGWLVHSESYQGLNSLASKFSEKIQSIYIDPPFNTGEQFDYVDNFKSSTWLSLLSNKLWLTKTLLTKTGSIFVHLDHSSDYLGRILLNDFFGEENFKNQIIWYYWNKFQMRGMGAYPRNHQSIYFYARDQKENHFYPQVTPLDRPKKLKRIFWDKEKNRIQNVKDTEGKVVYDEVNDTGLDDVWDIPYLGTTSKERTGFDTQKPEELIKRIILSSSLPTEMVLDFFSGSGTTLSAAQKLRRKWLGIELGSHFNDFYINSDGEKATGILGRLKEVLAGKGNHEPCGISAEEKWTGGGFFKYYELEQYEDVLRRAHYADADLFHNPYEDPYHSYVFLRDLKMLDSVEIEEDQNKAHFHPERLYTDIDLAETLSQRRGKWIKRITTEFVEFQDGERMSLTDPDWQTIKPLVWWQ